MQRLMKGPIRKIDAFVNQHRQWALLAAVLLAVWIVALINWVTDSDIFRQFFFPKACDPEKLATCDPVPWKDLFQAAVVVLGLPIAFLLWHWRDRNVRDQIENARDDITLKEFQEVQLRAAGALDRELPTESREQLQIAALHQLRGFLRGDYGQRFKRPAFELLLAGHAAAVHRIGVSHVQAQIAGKSKKEIDEAVKALRGKLTAIDRTRMLIIRDEAEHIFTNEFPLDGRRFDLLDLSWKRFPGKLNLTNSHFFEARFIGTFLKSAVMFGTHLESAEFHCAYLEGTVMRWAHFEGAALTGIYIDNKTEFEGAKFSNSTKFGSWESGREWERYSEDDKAARRQPWIERGMINVDASPLQTSS
jgi:Pentapeptide repeats (8 copies)